MEMKCLIHKDGRREIVKNVALSPKDGECVFSVKASGICGSDLPRVFNGASYYYPIVLGHEFAGIVEDSLNPNLIGKRACVFPILPCGECEYCQKEQWANCIKYDYYGSRRDGGMQSQLLIKESNLVYIPDNVSYLSASMIEPTAVCLHAVKKAGIKKGDSVLIYGAGTIGLLCGMWAKAFGVENVEFFDVNSERIAFAKSLGFSEYKNSKVDVVMEASGASVALNDAINNCKNFGKIVLVGHGKKDVVISHVNYALILRKQLTLFGTWNSDFTKDVNDWKESIEAIANGMINPEKLITHKIPLENADLAFDIIEKNVEFYNKITVVN
jgi:L-iditol 2-dehydrogenase